MQSTDDRAANTADGGITALTEADIRFYRQRFLFQFPARTHRTIAHGDDVTIIDTLAALRLPAEPRWAFLVRLFAAAPGNSRTDVVEALHQPQLDRPAMKYIPQFRDALGGDTYTAGKLVDRIRMIARRNSGIDWDKFARMLALIDELRLQVERPDWRDRFTDLMGKATQ